jgi:hypothetical protein
MQGRRLNQRTLIAAGVTFVVLVVALLVLGDDIGLFGTSRDTATPERVGQQPGAGQQGDSDGDGFPDDVDQCPNQAGTHDGCPQPVPDTDGDGIGDVIDQCITQPGPP